jgi:4-hydroxy-tetrahydrodipicolinate synthase
MRELAGVLPIVQTPFDECGEIDFAALAREIDWAFAQGANGCGTGMVSETLRLSDDERRTLAKRLVEMVAGRGPLFVSVGAESIRQAVALARHAQAAGCDAIMAMPPTLSALSSESLLDYYFALAEAVELPLIVQDASSYVGQAIPMSVHVELLKRLGPSKVLFKPEAAPLGPTISALRDATGGAARIYEGSGGILLIDSLRRGVIGTMPGVDLLDGIVAIWRAMQRGDEDAAYRIHAPVAAIVSLEMQAGLDGFLAIEKYILAKRGIIAYAMRRRPYRWELDGETAAEVDRLLVRLQQALTESAKPR